MVLSWLLPQVTDAEEQRLRLEGSLRDAEKRLTTLDAELRDATRKLADAQHAEALLRAQLR